MKSFLKAYHTDIGIKKLTNQDSILLQESQCGGEDILLAVLCDGMGGLKKGELASATVVCAFADWFRQQYAYGQAFWDPGRIQEQWEEIIYDCNRRMIDYGVREGVQIGTTLTAVMIRRSGSYLVSHIGDTRAYYVSDKLEQLTEDHTLMTREIRCGNITEEQALTDSRRNILMQCIGVNQSVEPQFLSGNLLPGHAILLCSDGFRHEISQEELLKYLKPDRFYKDEEIKSILVDLVDMNKQRKETDNISAIYLKKL